MNMKSRIEVDSSRGGCGQSVILIALMMVFADFIGVKTTTRSRDLELKFARVKVDSAAAKGDATVGIIRLSA